MSSQLVRLLAPTVATGALLAGVIAVAPAAPAARASSVLPSLVDSSARRCAPDPALPKRQLRGEWLASVVNIDWPSEPGLSAAQQKAELIGWLDEARADGLNAVVLQIRPTADAFWPSPFEPWSKYLTGTQGRSPGYDPLAFAVEQAHRRNLELHGWFNPYRVSMDTDVNALAASHPARRHPEWRVSYGGKLYYNPGVPAARRYVEKAILHAVRSYDIDAVHFDDYFYPYPTADRFPDRQAFRTYGGDFPDTAKGLADWRRHNINLLIREMDTQIAAIKPWVTFGVSPFAIWRNASTDPRGSQTQGGVETYDDLYADTRTWVRRGWVDYIAPQIYWNIGYQVADYATLTRWWSRQVKGTGVRLHIGQAVYKIGDASQDPAWGEPGEIRKHLTFNRRVNADGGQVDGDIFYSASGVRANRLNGMGLTFAEHYQRPALLPVNTFVPGGSPAAPTRLRATRTGNRVTLTWRGRGSSFAIYRFARPEDVVACSRVDAAHLVGAVRRVAGRPQSWRTTVRAGRSATFVVTGLSWAHREGRPAQASVAP
jgi:uncharacterized lipoprotein YddW (UPF0748 family)